VVPVKQRSSTTQKLSKPNPPKRITTPDAIAMQEGTYMHEELADRGYSQRHEETLTSRKLATYHAQKGRNEVEEEADDDDDDDEDDEDDDDELAEDSGDDDEEEEESEDEEAEDEEAGRPRRTASSHPRKAGQDALLDDLIGPDADSSHPTGDFPPQHEDCTLASLYYIY
jgi:hypothetical protein